MFLNNELTLRADLGLFSFPEKDLHYRFLSRIKPVYYLRTRAYSRPLTSPFVINYSGAIFREYPAPWQVMVKQNTGELVCVRGGSRTVSRLGEAWRRCSIALGLADEDGPP